MTSEQEEAARTSREVIMDMVFDLVEDALQTSPPKTADQERAIEAINIRLCAALGITADDPL